MECKIKKLIKKLEINTQRILNPNDVVVQKSPRHSKEQTTVLLAKAFHVLGYQMCNESLDLYQLFLESILFIQQYPNGRLPFKIHCLNPTEEMRMFLQLVVKVIQHDNEQKVAEYVTTLDDPRHYLNHQLVILDLQQKVDFPELWLDQCPNLIIVGPMWFRDKFRDIEMLHMVCPNSRRRNMEFFAPLRDVFEQEYFDVFVSQLKNSKSVLDESIMSEYLKTANLTSEYNSLRLSRYQRWQEQFLSEIIMGTDALIESKLTITAEIFLGNSLKVPNRILMLSSVDVRVHLSKFIEVQDLELEKLMSREFPFMILCDDVYLVNEFTLLSHLLFRVDPYIHDFYLQTRRHERRQWMYGGLVNENFLTQWHINCPFRTHLKELFAKQQQQRN